MHEQFDVRRKLMHARLNRLKGVKCLEPLGLRFLTHFRMFPASSAAASTA